LLPAPLSLLTSVPSKVVAVVAVSSVLYEYSTSTMLHCYECYQPVLALDQQHHCTSTSTSTSTSQYQFRPPFEFLEPISLVCFHEINSKSSLSSASFLPSAAFACSSCLLPPPLQLLFLRPAFKLHRVTKLVTGKLEYIPRRIQYAKGVAPLVVDSGATLRFCRGTCIIGLWRPTTTIIWAPL
jgi:hypothetical protein